MTNNTIIYSRWLRGHKRRPRAFTDIADMLPGFHHGCLITILSMRRTIHHVSPLHFDKQGYATHEEIASTRSQPRLVASQSSPIRRVASSQRWQRPGDIDNVIFAPPTQFFGSKLAERLVPQNQTGQFITHDAMAAQQLFGKIT